MVRSIGSRARLVLFSVLVALGGTPGPAVADYIFGTPTDIPALSASSPPSSCPSVSTDGLSFYLSRWSPH
jgi:hypothetical protein